MNQDSRKIFARAMNLFTKKPLETKQEIQDLYVDRTDVPLAELKMALLYHTEPFNILFTGHMGSGKSTELNQLKFDSEIQQKFMVIDFALREHYNPYDVKYHDILTLLGTQIFFQSNEKYKIKLSKKLLKDLESWCSKITILEDTTFKTEASVEANVNAFFIKLADLFKSTHTKKEEARRTIEPRINELIEKINAIIEEVENKDKSNRRILVIIDDTDKIPPDLAMPIFFNNGDILSQPNCFLIYTIPISLRYSKKLKAIQSNFEPGDSFNLPNIKIFSRDGSPNQDGINFMTEVIKRRLELKYIETKGLKIAIEKSGGVIRELTTIMHKSCAKAIRRKENIISEQCVKEAVLDMQNDHTDSLDTQDYKLLIEKMHDKRVVSDERLLDLFHNLKLLEYYDEKGKWCSVNPILLPLIQELDSKRTEATDD